MQPKDMSNIIFMTFFKIKAHGNVQTQNNINTRKN